MAIEQSTNRTPIFYPYCRTSSDDNTENSLENQVRGLTRYFEYRFADKNFKLSQPFQDNGISGSTPFAERPAGAQLIRALRPGDAIGFNKFDRGFRDTFDYIHTHRTWNKAGVTLHVLDLPVDASSDIGEMVLGIMAFVAQYERRKIISRMNEIRGIRRNHNLPNNQKAKLGWILAGPSGKRHFVIDHDARAQCFQFLDWKKQGIRIEQIERMALEAGMRVPKHIAAKRKAHNEIFDNTKNRF